MTRLRPAPALLLLFFCGFMSAPLTAQVGGVVGNPQPEARPKPGETCTVEGIVLRADTNEPIRRAQVTLARSGRGESIRAFTDVDGKFSLRDVPPGSYFLTAERQGFIRQGFGQRNTPQGGSALQLTPSQVVKDVVFRLVPWAVISGRVYDEEGEPLVGANVEVLRYSYSRGRRQLQRTQVVTTDDRGEYRIFGLQPGRYYVNASYFSGGRVLSFGRGRGTRPATSAAPSDESYAPTYYPGTNDPSRALPLDLRGGQEVTGLDFSVQLLPTVRVRGRVTNGSTGAAVRGAMVVLTPRETELRAFFSRNQDVTDTAQGDFEIRGVIPGSYYLSATWYDQGRSMSARIPLDVGSSDVEGMPLSLTPSGTLEGQIKVEGGGPLPSMPVPVQIEGRGNVQIRINALRLALFASDDALANVLTAATRSDGTFNFREVAPGTYSLALLDPPTGYYLKSAALAGKDVLDSGLDLRGGSPGVPLDVTISPNGARLDGVVMADDQHAAPGAVVVLVPDAPRRNQWSLFKLATADTSGQFSFQGIAPGEYKLFAWPDLEPGAHMDPEFLRPYESKGVVVRVEESGRYTQSLILLPLDTRFS